MADPQRAGLKHFFFGCKPARSHDLFYVIPVEVTYQWGNVHFLAGTGVAIPVSSYDPTRLANASHNYYGINQTVAVTWFPSPKWELSAQAEFTFNFRNPATQYLSGDIFDMDFGIGYKPFDSLPGLQLGLNGFVAEQLTRDQTATRYVAGGNYFRKFALGRVSRARRHEYWRRSTVREMKEGPSSSAIRC
jgi:hypothetical protein